MNINTKEYWDGRFGSGDWANKGGFSQTHGFAVSYIPRLGLSREFSGKLVDFGCGAGDAMPLYREAFRSASIVGVDFSESAVHLCRERYGMIAEFTSGTFDAVPDCDVIICSNVLEHLDDDHKVVESLLKKCSKLFVIVPFDEQHLGSEHLRRYYVNSFSEFDPVRVVIYASRGWSEFGLRLWVNVWAKNVFRYLWRRPLRHRRMQILYEFKGARQ